ncbi:ATPase [Paenibacillus sp. GCM10023248]|uniref:ATPase n=1 Tax=unclassified Paenibacillus TaxID=185978 RepID=UPI0023784272|nr:ATPase [Paenibacillus sp. MAHUQ-63]MDD9266003.1 ATPase [Paenibacillus sp. MAHUQ-63]
MQIKFISLHLISYTGHDEITVNYGDITKLTGKNGEGKSSIGGAPSWIMWGCDLTGGKFDPSPTDRPYERVYASLTLSVNGAEQTLTREIIGGTNKFYVNQVPMKAKEFESHVAGLFTKEQFLALYSPGFFFNQHWSKQREQVMQHVSAPTNKEVFQAMTRTSPDQKVKDIILNPHAARLEEELKKHTIADLEKKYTDLKGKNDKLHIQSQGSVKTLSDQLKALGPAAEIDREALQTEGEELDRKIQSYEADKSKVTQWENQRSRLQMQIDSLSQRIIDGKAEHARTKGTEINTTCNSCGQELTEEAKATSLDNKKTVVNGIAKRVNDMIEQKKELVAQLEAFPLMEGPNYSVADLISRIGEINSILQADITRAKAASELDKAKQNEVEYLKAKNDSIFVLDAIKAFKATEAQLQVSKVQELFTTLSVRLFDYVASTGEYKPAFVIQMDGKDYPTLSAGEKIGAGLELSDVLYKQSELIVPTFVDGIESYTGKVLVYGQLITGRAVPDQELKIETEVIA